MYEPLLKKVVRGHTPHPPTQHIKGRLLRLLKQHRITHQDELKIKGKHLKKYSKELTLPRDVIQNFFTNSEMLIKISRNCKASVLLYKEYSTEILTNNTPAEYLN